MNRKVSQDSLSWREPWYRVTLNLSDIIAVVKGGTLVRLIYADVVVEVGLN